MTMRITVGQLRRILREMKLGVAGAQGDARAWGKKPLPDEPIYSPPEGGETYIATDLPNFEPPKEEIDAWNKYVQDMAKKHANEPWDPDPAEALGPPDERGDRPTRRKMETVRVTVGQLRKMIREAGSVEPDPFADPAKKPDLKAFAQNVLKCEELLGDMPKVLGQVGDRTSVRTARNMLKKAAGLAYHASNDLKALEAILTIVAKDLRKN
jgi:hypothetical protein